MPNTTYRSSLPAEVNNYYDRLLLTIAMPLLVYASFGQARAIPKNAGSDTIKFRRYSLLAPATTNLTEGTTPAGTQMATTDITAQVLQYGNFTYISDVVQDQTPDPIMTEITMLFGQNMANTNDQLTSSVVTAGTTVQYAGGAVARSAVSSTINATEIAKAQRTLASANAVRLTGFSGVSVGIGTQPIPPAYVAICHPKTSFDIRNAAGFTPVEKYNPNATILPGEIGTVNQIRFCETTNAVVFAAAGASGADVYATLFLGANAYGVIDLGNSQAASVIYQPPVDPLHQKSSLGWKEYFTAKVLNDNFMCRVEHTVSA
jgi:N4-gp56 family major capsid protein